MDISELLAGKKKQQQQKQKKKKQQHQNSTRNQKKDDDAPNNEGNDDDTTTISTTTTEDQLLESLGTKRAETSTYESDVLRQATFKLAPKLRVELSSPSSSSSSSASRSSGGIIKFPDFITETSLLPFNATQGANKANRQVVLRVLQKIQSQMKAHDGAATSADSMRLLAMKQNILLSMLGQHSKRPDIQQAWKQQTTETLPIYQQIEQQSQQQRRKRISIMERKQMSNMPGSQSLIKAQQQQRSGKKRRAKWKDWSSDEESDDEDTPKTRPVLPEMNYSRRRMAKAAGKTTNKKTAPAARNNSITRRRKRQTRVAAAAIKSTTTATTTTRNSIIRKRTRRNSKTATTTKEEEQGQEGEVDNSIIMELDLRNISANNIDISNDNGGRPKRQNRTKVTSYAEIETEIEKGIEEEQDQDQERGSGDDDNKQQQQLESSKQTTQEEVVVVVEEEEVSLSTENNTTALEEEEEEQQQAGTTTTSVDDDADVSDPVLHDDTTTTEKPTTTLKTTLTTTNVKQQQEQEGQKLEDTSVSPPKTTTTTETTPPPAASETIVCPLCQKMLPKPTTNGDVDSQLAQHMAECQQQQQEDSSSISSTRRSSRRKRNPLANGSYKEVEYDDVDDDDLIMMETEEEEEEADTTTTNRTNKKRKRTSSTATTETTTTTTTGIRTTTTIDSEEEEENGEANIAGGGEDVNNFGTDAAAAAAEDEDDQFVFDADMDEEEDELEDDIPLLKPTSIDDYLLDDYEDRIDYWRLKGISEMKDMSALRGDGEIDPGPTCLDGKLHIPGWMNNRLFGYQRTGLEWMWTLHQQQAGGVMGDEMGLGKTVQVSSFLGAMAASRQLKGVLIISPATMLQHWLSELAVWAPGLRRVLLHSSGDSSSSETTTSRNGLVNHGPAIFRNLRDWLKLARRERLYEKIGSSSSVEGEDNDYDEEGLSEDSLCGTGYAVITTYEHVRRNQDDYVNHPWSYVVMDEAQKIRNPTADITLACKRLRTPHRIAMTGTPIQNDLKELWSLFDFVFPGRLGTLPAFEEEFAGPIKRGGYSNASPVQVQLAYRCSLVLRDLIDPYLLRRQKAEIDEVRRMPSKTEHVLFCRLSKRQRSMYESFLKSDMVKKIFRGSTLLFAAITMLRKICNHPDLVLPDSSEEALEAFLRNGCVPEHSLNSDDEDAEGEDDEDDYDPFPDAGDRLEERSGKFQVMAKILPLWKKQGHRVLIFSQWTKMLNIIQQFVVAQGWKFLRLDGKTNVASRQRLVDQFNSDKSYFGMLCTTRTGGVGLNLTGANKLVLYDVDWNPQTDAQARERAWRFGQEKQVTVYRLCTAGTIEEKMYQRQIFKTALTNKVLHDPRQKRLFSQKDLHDLLTLQPDNGKASGAGGEDTIETTERLAKASRKDEGVGTVDASQNLSKDDGETLASVLKSKGLAGVFDHNFVDPSASGGNKSQSAREMEEQAKQIAREAAEALKSSVNDTAEEDDPFTPTWTGAAPESRFGGGSHSSSRNERRGSGSSFGSASTAGVRNTNSGGGGSNNNKSSGSLLASIRQRNEAIKSGGSNQQRRSSSNDNGGINNNNGKNSHQYTKLLVRIRDYVRNHSPTSDEILDAFASVPDCDAAIFKRLLNSVAKNEYGRWKLLPEHR